MAIPKKWTQIDGQLCNNLSVEQFSTETYTLYMFRHCEPNNRAKRLTFTKIRKK